MLFLIICVKKYRSTDNAELLNILNDVNSINVSALNIAKLVKNHLGEDSYNFGKPKEKKPVSLYMLVSVKKIFDHMILSLL
jgi:hypothetical protein